MAEFYDKGGYMADDRYVTEPPAVERTTDDPDVARAEIEMTRTRMSETIDDIEDALLRKKARIQDRLDVLAPVRENPLPSAAAALGAGLLLGLLTGGDDDESDDRYEVRARAYSGDFDDELLQAEERAATWEARARRLMKLAREQEEELEASSRGRGRDWDDEEYDDELDDVSGIRSRVTEGVTGFLGTMARDLFTPMR